MKIMRKSAHQLEHSMFLGKSHEPTRKWSHIIGVEVNGLFVASHHEYLIGDLFHHSHTLSKGVTINYEVMGATDNVDN